MLVSSVIEQKGGKTAVIPCFEQSQWLCWAGEERRQDWKGEAGCECSTADQKWFDSMKCCDLKTQPLGGLLPALHNALHYQLCPEWWDGTREGNTETKMTDLVLLLGWEKRSLHTCSSEALGAHLLPILHSEALGTVTGLCGSSWASAAQNDRAGFLIV